MIQHIKLHMIFFSFYLSAATGMKWIETKLKLLGVSNHTDYKICFYLDADAMISVHTPKYGVIEVIRQFTLDHH